MKEAARAHSLLNTLLHEAIQNGKVFEASVLLDYYGLCNETEDLELYTQPNNVKVRVYIKTMFDSSKDMGQSVEEQLKEIQYDPEDN